MTNLLNSEIEWSLYRLFAFSENREVSFRVQPLGCAQNKLKLEL
jgi:hypothetical protein